MRHPLGGSWRTTDNRGVNFALGLSLVLATSLTLVAAWFVRTLDEMGTMEEA